MMKNGTHSAMHSAMATHTAVQISIAQFLPMHRLSDASEVFALQAAVLVASQR
jgi:hypothetical protein